MIRVDKLSFAYPDKNVFESFSHTFGQITCIAGPSGCGKTTMLRLLAGLEKPKGGVIEGVPACVAVLFQEDRLLPWCTARQNVQAVLPTEAAGEAAEWLLKVELGDWLDSLPEKLSGGQRRRVALARTLAYRGDLILLDEPFKGFDPALTQRMAALLLAQRVPIIAAVHAPEEMALLGGEVLRLA